MEKLEIPPLPPVNVDPACRLVPPMQCRVNFVLSSSLSRYLSLIHCSKLFLLLCCRTKWHAWKQPSDYCIIFYLGFYISMLKMNYCTYILLFYYRVDIRKSIHHLLFKISVFKVHHHIHAFFFFFDRDVLSCHYFDCQNIYKKLIKINNLTVFFNFSQEWLAKISIFVRYYFIINQPDSMLWYVGKGADWNRTRAMLWWCTGFQRSWRLFW